MEASVIMPKEQLTSSNFIKNDVLSSPDDRAYRKFQLQRALTLGNLYRAKVSIKFRNEYGESRKVETTIWSVFENYVGLKGGRLIPIHAIEEIEF
ncbi:MAG: hypothetical protein ACLFUB_19350 [Cyclobacteriaceae bacterium]